MQKNVADEILSIRSLMSRQESQVIITDPRDYQVELFERAKKENVIAVLDTGWLCVRLLILAVGLIIQGSGKTLIAVLLLKHIIDQEMESRAAGNPRRIAFFLV